MKKEKVILSFVATLFGLLVAGIAFFIFQSTKTIEPTNTNSKTISITSPTPTPIPSIFLTIDRPKDEEVVSEKTIVVSGKTANNAVVVVITDSLEDVVTPSANGDFSTTAILGKDQSVIEIIAISPNGESIRTKRTITYSQEEF
ncbi:MAG: hypothetical protein Q8P26_00370 [Candidatus Levybacteria bacterium]|nr:hypothetical protein [Candidatus Levybacteria bacterium]MDZ4228305.1 hypothetical protein [Candidatus Levybacteria bacterium]